MEDELKIWYVNHQNNYEKRKKRKKKKLQRQNTIRGSEKKNESLVASHIASI